MIAVFTIFRGIISTIVMCLISAASIQVGLAGIAVTILGFGATIGNIVVGIGLLNLKPWARQGALILWTLEALLSLLNLEDRMVNLVLAIISIIYLSAKDVKQTFVTPTTR